MSDMRLDERLRAAVTRFPAPIVLRRLLSLRSAVHPRQEARS